MFDLFLFWVTSKLKDGEVNIHVYRESFYFAVSNQMTLKFDVKSFSFALQKVFELPLPPLIIKNAFFLINCFLATNLGVE